MIGKQRLIGIGMVPAKGKFGKFVRSERLKLSLSQFKLSKSMGVSQNLISHIEIGVQKRLKEKHLIKLAEKFGCEIEKLREYMPKQAATGLGKIICSQLEKNGISFLDFTNKIKISTQSIHKLKRTKSIDYKRMRFLMETLNIEPSILVEFLRKNRKPSQGEPGQKIRDQRRELGLSTNEFAKKIGVSTALISQIELGQYRFGKNNKTMTKIVRYFQDRQPKTYPIINN